MFIPVVTYDPDMFADFTFVLSQQEISSSSQPNRKYDNENQSAISLTRTSATAISLTLGANVWSLIQRKRTAAVDTLTLKPVLATQSQSKFMPESFNSNPPAPVQYAPVVCGQFATTATLDVLFDNIVFRVQTGNLDLSDTKVTNKPVAPVVG
ncbi:hypothetical protein pEaSNUABM46_00091 [Erwinia phage pEa_SNUABM_46]|nr:hypothetical protein pEaSNUABM45_00091 [Erwinia phage pEa_SNUABM_45]QYW04075.1 hypothetical protein pEaSNUABM46_00091 [Erwinia phage pEa_SNUABM_46]